MDGWNSLLEIRITMGYILTMWSEPFNSQVSACAMAWSGDMSDIKSSQSCRGPCGRLSRSSSRYQESVPRSVGEHGNCRPEHIKRRRGFSHQSQSGRQRCHWKMD